MPDAEKDGGRGGAVCGGWGGERGAGGGSGEQGGAEHVPQGQKVKTVKEAGVWDAFSA